MEKKIEVTVEMVSTEGKSTQTTIKIGKTGTSLKSVLEEAEISADKKDLFVNGEPATLDTHVSDKDAITAKAVKVKVSERPQGS